MAHADFVHLRVHSAYSLSEGAIRPKVLVKLCREHGIPAVAVTDTSNLFGALEFAQEAQKAGVQPIIGCQLAISREAGEPRNGTAPPPDQLVLLAQNQTGYENLMRLVSVAFLESDPGEVAQVGLDLLTEYAEGLIALTGGVSGALGRLLSGGQGPAAEALLKRLQEIFPGRLYVELQRHGLPEEEAIEAALLDLAYAQDLPLVATNEAYFPGPDDYEAHDALLCIAGGAYIAQSDRRRLTPDHSFKTASEMRVLFADLPEAVDNTLVIARRCAYFPEFVKPILPAFPTTEGRSEEEEMRAQSEEGLERRLEDQVLTGVDPAEREAVAAPYRERLAFELKVIQEMGFAGYFLIVADFIKWAKTHDIPVGPGRGSGAGSVVAWALTITDLDPLRFGLLFERFLNPERVSMPDFDIDFCQDRRDEVIRYVQDKYGRDHVAQIITFGKLQARAALRDVGRVLQMPYPQVDRICKLVPNNPANPVTLQQAIDGEPQLQEMRREDEAVNRLITIALRLEGLYRHASTHAAGVVIGDRPLDRLVPLYRDPRSDMPVTQFNMKYVEQAGLVKFDFLGLKTLTVLQRACALLEQRGVTVDLTHIPLDDAGAFEMMSRGDTVGVFQFESSGMRSLLREARVDTFEDIIALVALYRPGPMENIPKYVACKYGKEQPEVLHETIEPVVKDTYGVIIYQEQVMQIAQVFADYSLGQADLLRRAMGKKIKAEMDAQRDIFVKGAMAKGVTKDRASYVFDLVDKFAGYGFNKAHSAGYALVAYQTAYLKANHPVEFIAASMTYDMGNTDKLNVYRQELQRLGIALLLPDINRSERDFSVEALDDGTPAIRYALAAVKNVGGAAMDSVIEERQSGGAFKSLADFAQRVDVKQINKRQVENLARAGAFDDLSPNRAQVYHAAETIVRYASAAASERESAQVNLFGAADESEPLALPLPPVEDWPGMDRLRNEFDAIGFYLSAHPLDTYGPTLEKIKAKTSTEVMQMGKSDLVTMAGIVIGKRELNSRKGNRMAFVQLTDASGVFEVTLFSETLSQAREFLEGGQPLSLKVSVEHRGEDEPRLTAQSLEPLDNAAARGSDGLNIHLTSPKPLSSLKSILEREGRGRRKVKLVLTLADGQEVELALGGGYQLSPTTRQAIKAIPGIVMQER
ncbi:DNA polymerase III subunit alpha [Pelagibius litoralis]|uniref:DNA polymerase III subunit alpha n=1 Tax=Pelagibius litoralis TaxID=374515 RepID=A0A967EUN7_9PROT|nr:DNA polymerase III subunit alpha [Pelagibius litoralis]NIA67292.1 DNA polymerase III subunit alpha [Pelagibius litoralis]